MGNLSNKPDNRLYRDVLKEYGLNFPDFQRYEKIFSSLEIEICITFGKTKSGYPGKPYLTFERAGKTIVMDAGIVGQCLGFIFPGINEDSKDIRKRSKDAGKKLKDRDELDNGDFFVFNVDVFEEILNVLSVELLSDSLNMTVEELASHSDNLKQYGRKFKLEYIGNNPLLLFSNTDLELITNLGFTNDYQNCLGFIFRNPNETDIKFSRRRKYTEKKYLNILNKNIFLIEYSEKKFIDLIESLPEKKKRVVKQRNSVERVKELDRLQGQVFRFLKPELEDGTAVVLAKKVMEKRDGEGVLSRKAKFPIVDMLFSSSGKDELQFKYLDLNGWKYPVKEKVGEKSDELKTYRNVCGIIVVHDDISSSDRKKLCRVARAQLGSYYPLQPSSIVMAVDSRLLKKWKTFGAKPNIIESDALTPSNSANGNNLANPLGDYGNRQTEYGVAPAVLKNVKPTSVGVHVYEPGGKSHIGGTQIHLSVDYGENHSKSVALDSGWVFDLNPTWNGIGKGPSYVDGIQPFLAGGMWGLNARHYRTDLLINSFRPDIIQSLKNLGNGVNYSSANEFIGLELFHRLGREGFENLMREKMPAAYRSSNRLGNLSKRSFWNPLQEREAQMYSEKDIMMMLLLSHAHQDHSIGSSIFRDEITRGLSPITRAILLADHKISGNWLVQDTAARKMREHKKIGASYPVFEYPYMLFNGDGTRVQIADNIYVTSFVVEHSIPGSLAFKVEVEHNGELLASVIHPGDYKNGDIFKKFGDSGRVDLMFAEGTNPPNAKKDSTNHTEENVKEKMAEVIKESNEGKKLLIIDLVKNNFERLNNIIEEASARGRTIVISPRIAYRCQFIELMQRRVHISKRIKIPDLDMPNVKIWKRNMRSHVPEHRRMFHQYGAVDQDLLSENPQQYVLIREGHERPEKVTGIYAPAIWIRSVYGDYDPEARSYTKECNKIAKRKGWDLRRKGYHATGHGPLLYSSHPEAENGILGQMHEANASKIAIIHTQKRHAVHKVMLSYPTLAETEIISTMTHPQKPGDKGHYIPIWSK